MIVDQTNLYASQVMEPSQHDKWTKLTADELWAYFGFMILMGVSQLPALADYWKLDPTYRYSPIADSITRDRFLEISTVLQSKRAKLFSLYFIMSKPKHIAIGY